MRAKCAHIILVLLLPVAVAAQSDFDLSQRWFNQAAYNPAATGGEYSLAIFMHARQQWAGLDGAPVTGVVSADAYLEAIRSGMGVSVSADRIGFTNTYSGRFAYAFHFPFSKKSFLSLGLSAGVLGRSVNASNALIDNLNDPTVFSGNKSEYTPDFDVGAEYQGIIRVGAAVRHIGVVKGSNAFASNSMHLWSYVSGRINAIDYLSIEPVASYTIRDDINRFEVGVIAHLVKRYGSRSSTPLGWLGAMYRLNKQLSVMAGLYIGKQLRLGYSFDYGLGALSKISSYGTHELMLAWTFDSLFKMDIPCISYGRSKKMNKFY